MIKIMIAEDDLLMADQLAELLVEHKYEVCGIARTVEEGVAIAERHKPDLAILDVRLAKGGLGTEIAARLRGKNRPAILYATGNVGQLELTKADGEACLGKPFIAPDVVLALKIVEQILTNGEIPRPFPARFRLLLPPQQTEDPAASDHVSQADAHEFSNEVMRLRRQQGALARFGSFALGEPDLAKVLTEAVRVCAEGLGVPFCKICRYRPEENDLLIEAGIGWKPGIIGCVVSRADETSPQGRAFTTGKPIICHNLAKDATFILPAFYADHGIVSTVDVIIKKEGQVYGILQIDSPVQHDYDEHDVDFLTGFANVLGEAVNTAKRTTALRAALVQMQDMVAGRDRLLEAKSILLTEKIILLQEKSRLLDDKNVLAQELQRRVRNNLQLVSGMLDKQLRSTTDAAGRIGIDSIIRRVMALAQVYDHLLGTGMNRRINFGNYLLGLSAEIESMHRGDYPDVKVVCQSDPVMLDLDSATTLGLVIAELLNNSYDHAFPRSTGTIWVSLLLGATGADATVILADDGIGFIEDADTVRRGVELVRRLMEQVEGHAELCSDHGTEWTLTFPVPSAVETPTGRRHS